MNIFSSVYICYLELTSAKEEISKLKESQELEKVERAHGEWPTSIYIMVVLILLVIMNIFSSVYIYYLELTAAKKQVTKLKESLEQEKVERAYGE